MPSCVIKDCKNNSFVYKNSSMITFHKFPKEERLKENWIKAVRISRLDTNWLPTKCSVICCLHFEDDDIYNTRICGFPRIKKNAVPKKIHFINSEWCHKIEQSDPLTLQLHTEYDIKEESETSENDSCLSGQSTEDISKSQKYTSNVGNEMNDSDIEAMFDTPEEYKLRQRVKRFQQRHEIHRRKIRALEQKVRRLEKKNAKSKSILQDLKKKLKYQYVLSTL